VHTPSDMRRIDFNSPLPYYHQLAEILREEIERGTWGVGELIPAEGALTEMFGVSRSVTRKTLDILEGEGRVLRIKGKGTIVTRPKVSYHAVSAAGDWFSPRAETYRLGRVISAGRVPVGGYIGRLLDMAAREDIWEISLTHASGDTTVSLSQLYLRIQGTLSVGAPPEFEPGGPGILNQLATKYQLELTTAELQIEIVEASEFEAEVLSVPPGSPLAQLSTIESGKRLAGFVRTVVRPENFFFAASLHRNPEVLRNRSLSTLAAESSR